MVRRLLLVGATVAALSCAPPKTAADYLRTGDIKSAIDEYWLGSSTADDALVRDLARAAFAHDRPKLVVSWLHDDDVARLFGAHTARRILSHYWVIQAKLEVRGALLLGAAGIYLRIENAKGQAVPWDNLADDIVGLAMFTHERLPLRKLVSSELVADPLFHFELLPKSLHNTSVEFPQRAIEAVVFGLPWLLSVRGVDHYAELTDEELQAICPRARRLEKDLRTVSGFTDGTLATTYFFQRPVEADGPFTARVTLGFNAHIGARLSLPLERAAAGRPGMVVDLATPGVTPIRWPAKPDEGPPAAVAPDALSDVGLELPLPPPSLTTPGASLAARPVDWPINIGEDYTPNPGAVPGADDLHDVPTASEGESVALVRCEVQPHDAVVDVRVDGKLVRRHGLGGIELPLLDLDPKADLPVELRSPDAAIVWGTGTLVRQGGAFVPKIRRVTRESALSCKAYTRDAVEAELRRRLVVAYDRLEDIEARAPRVDVGLSDLGLREDLRPAYEAVIAAAALVGWSDPRVVPVVDRVRRLEGRFNEGVRAAVALWQKQPADPPAGFRVLGVDCGRAAKVPTPPSACQVRLETPPYFEPSRVREETMVVLEDGRVLEPKVYGGDRVGEVRLTVPAALIPPSSAQSAPWRLVVRQHGEAPRLLPIPQ